LLEVKQIVAPVEVCTVIMFVAVFVLAITIVFVTPAMGGSSTYFVFVEPPAPVVRIETP
jgi:hypothetical protein